MSTPIETNTEQLQEVLQQVYDLPNRSGGSSEPDLVIGLNMANTKTPETQDRDHWPSTTDFNLSDVSIESGSLEAVKEKILNGITPKIVLKEITFYDSALWSRIIGEPVQAALCNTEENYPSSNCNALNLIFVRMVSPETGIRYGLTSPSIAAIVIDIDLETGEPMHYVWRWLTQ